MYKTFSYLLSFAATTYLVVCDYSFIYIMIPFLLYLNFYNDPFKYWYNIIFCIFLIFHLFPHMLKYWGMLKTAAFAMKKYEEEEKKESTKESCNPKSEMRTSIYDMNLNNQSHTNPFNPQPHMRSHSSKPTQVPTIISTKETGVPKEYPATDFNTFGPTTFKEEKPLSTQDAMAGAATFAHTYVTSTSPSPQTRAAEASISAGVGLFVSKSIDKITKKNPD